MAFLPWLVLEQFSDTACTVAVWCGRKPSRIFGCLRDAAVYAAAADEIGAIVEIFIHAKQAELVLKYEELDAVMEFAVRDLPKT